jgi:hypothetical protein
MRGVLSLLLVVLCLGCMGCGGSGQSFSVQEVGRVFAGHGLPFTTQIKIAKRSVFGLPRPKEHALDRHLRGVLAWTNPRTFSVRFAYIFDSSASLKRARRLDPRMLSDHKGHLTVTKNSTSESGCAMHRENVFIMAAAQYCTRMRAILSDLH